MRTWLLLAALAGAGGCSPSRPEAKKDSAGASPASPSPTASAMPQPADISTVGAEAAPAPGSAAPPPRDPAGSAAIAGDEDSSGPIAVVSSIDRSRLEPAVRAQLDAAEAGYRQTPDDIAAVGLLAMLYHAYGMLPEAAQLYQRAIDLDAQAFRWPYLRAHVAMGMRDSPATVTYLRKAHALRPDYMPAGLWLGRALLVANEPQEALRVLQPLQAAHPDEAIVAFTLGLAYLDVKEPVYGLEYLKPVMDRYPDLGAVREAVARTFEMAGQPERAEEVRSERPANNFSPNLRDPEFVEIYRHTVGADAEKRRALAYLSAGDPVTALKHLYKAIEYAPDNVELQLMQADLMMRLGELEPAEKAFRAVLVRDPQSVPALTRLAQLHMARGEYDAAGALIAQGREVAPEDGVLLVLAARIATRKDDDAAAVELLQAARQQAPESAELLVELGGAHWRLGERDSAVEDFKAAVEFSPNYVPALQALADAYLEMGEQAAADSWYQRAYDAGGTDPVACYRTGVKALQNKDYERCEQALKRGLAADPDSAELNDALSRLYSVCPYAIYRNGLEALRLARKVYGEDDAQVPVRGLTALASAYAELGDFERAVALTRRAVALVEKTDDKALLFKLNVYLAKYEQGERVYEE